MLALVFWAVPLETVTDLKVLALPLMATRAFTDTGLMMEAATADMMSRVDVGFIFGMKL
jgi:hypothetical protein